MLLLALPTSPTDKTCCRAPVPLAPCVDRDELHTRLKFNHRGLLAYANQVREQGPPPPAAGPASPAGQSTLGPASPPPGFAATSRHSSHSADSRCCYCCCCLQNRADSNGSQFFITMDRVDHYNRQYTIFGKVTGVGGWVWMGGVGGVRATMCCCCGSYSVWGLLTTPCGVLTPPSPLSSHTLTV